MKNKKDFFTAKYDKIFKTIFGTKERKNLLEALLKNCLEKDVKIIGYLNTELPVSNAHERVKRLDLIVETEG